MITHIAGADNRHFLVSDATYNPQPDHIHVLPTLSSAISTSP